MLSSLRQSKSSPGIPSGKPIWLFVSHLQLQFIHLSIQQNSPPCLPLPIVNPVINTFPGSAGFEVQNFLAATPVWLMANAATTATFILTNFSNQSKRHKNLFNHQNQTHHRKKFALFLYVAINVEPTGILACRCGDRQWHDDASPRTCTFVSNANNCRSGRSICIDLHSGDSILGRKGCCSRSLKIGASDESHEAKIDTAGTIVPPQFGWCIIVRVCGEVVSASCHPGKFPGQEMRMKGSFLSWSLLPG